MKFEEKKSSGVAKAGLTTGIIGTSLGTLGILGGGSALLNGWGRNNEQAFINGMMAANMMAPGCNCGQNRDGCCNEDHFVTRYDAQKDARIAELETAVALRDANTYTDQKIIETYKDINGRLRNIEERLGQQAVINQATSDAVDRVQSNLECCCDKMDLKLEQEAERRCCGDNSIVNYVNATFYPQQVANITTGTTTTAEPRYNPLPKCCGCDNI